MSGSPEDLYKEVEAMEIGGQFLFDPADHRDFLGAILGTGVTREGVRKKERGRVVVDSTETKNWNENPACRGWGTNAFVSTTAESNHVRDFFFLI